MTATPDRLNWEYRQDTNLDISTRAGPHQYQSCPPPPPPSLCLPPALPVQTFTRHSLPIISPRVGASRQQCCLHVTPACQRLAINHQTWAEAQACEKLATVSKPARAATGVYERFHQTDNLFIYKHNSQSYYI